MKKLIIFSLFLLIFSGPFFAGYASDDSSVDSGEKYTLSFANFMPAESPFESEITAAFIEEIEKATDGRVEIENYPGGALLQGGNIYSGVVQGVADIGFECLSWVEGRFPVSYMFEQPGVPFESDAAATSSFNEAMEILNPKEFDDVKPLFFMCTGPGHIMSNVPIRSMEDMEGLEFRSTSAMAPAIKALGATPISMPVSDVYEALDRGVVDAHISPLEQLRTWGIAEVIDYVTMTPFLYNANFALVMNQESYNELPGDIQNTIDEVIDKIFKEHAVGFFGRQNKVQLEWAIKEHDLEVIELSEEEEERWHEQVIFVMEEYAEKLEEKGLPGKEAKQLMMDLGEKYNKKFK
ncbi:MAG: TRAP transporter substrate-binding protein [Desulfobacterales bacterium]